MRGCLKTSSVAAKWLSQKFDRNNQQRSAAFGLSINRLNRSKGIGDSGGRPVEAPHNSMDIWQCNILDDVTNIGQCDKAISFISNILVIFSYILTEIFDIYSWGGGWKTNLIIEK